MNTKLVRASNKDAEVILEMMRSFNQIFGYDFNAETRKKNLDQFISNADLGVIYLIRHGSDSIGYVAITFGFSFEYGGRDAFVDEIFLHEDYRNQGIGGHVLRELPTILKPFEVLAIHLEVERTNYQGQRVYLRSGFKGNDRNILTLKLAN